MKEYQLTELFGMFIHMPPDGVWDHPIPCKVCGVGVLLPDVHREWHDSIAN